MRIVLDTNVIVSALMNTKGVPAKILDFVLKGSVTVAFDNRILFEYIDVLSKKKFGFNSEIINNLVAYIKSKGEFINAAISSVKFIDETDKKFYEVYKSANARYLITGNIKHFPKETGIINPRDFFGKMRIG